MSMPDNANAATIAEIAERIAARLRHVCTHMSDEDFAAMVRRMAELEHKHYTRATWGILRSDAERRN